MNKPSDLAARAIRETLTIPNESDSNGETANVVDGLFAIARAIHDLADAVRETRGDDPCRPGAPAVPAPIG